MKPTGTLGAALAVLLLLMSGCAETPKTGGLSVSTSDRPAPVGMIIGNVADDEERPVPNATVELRELSRNTTTDELGDYRFLDVPVGRYTVKATHPRFNATARQVEVRAGAPAQGFLTLVARPEYKPYNFTRELAGQFECAAEYFIITGSCWTVVQGTSCNYVNYCVQDPHFKSKYEFPVAIGSRWDTILLEMTWEVGAGSLPGMHLYLENANVTQQGLHGKKVALAEGTTQPLTVRVDRGEAAPGAEKYDGSNVYAFVPDAGGDQLVRAFPLGNGYDYTSQVCEPTRGCFLGVGAGLNLKFTIQFTVFFNGRAPEGFSAIPG